MQIRAKSDSIVFIQLDLYEKDFDYYREIYGKYEHGENGEHGEHGEHGKQWFNENNKMIIDESDKLRVGLLEFFNSNIEIGNKYIKISLDFSRKPEQEFCNTLAIKSSKSGKDIKVGLCGDKEISVMQFESMLCLDKSSKYRVEIAKDSVNNFELSQQVYYNTEVNGWVTFTTICKYKKN